MTPERALGLLFMLLVVLLLTSLIFGWPVSTLGNR